MSDSVKVAVRIRPLIQRERDAEILWTNTERSIQQQKATGKCAVPYHFDRVFCISETTDDVYKEIAMPIISGAMLGFNGTIFAYGQTSSGKTYTMMGNHQNPGIIPRAVSEIFDTIENNPEREYLIRISYLEIYNENITDLLTSEKKPLDVREDTEGKVFVPNLVETLVNTKEQIIALMSSGDAKRHVGATNMNEMSSRSHAIFRIIIESRVRDQEGAVMVSQLNLVDLAGSEKAKATGATGQRLTEGGFINKSLFILGNVISQLSDNNAFISYRDSRLTRILQSSLGGNSKTAIICNISPAALDETHSSLRFATNAKRIKNKPVQNEVLSDEAMMQRYKKEIDTLKKELQQTRNLKDSGLLEANEQLQQKLAAKEAVQAAQEDRINRLKALICVSSQIRPTTPTLDMATKRKRRETWCPGKAGKAANKPTKSLPMFDEAQEDDFSPSPIMGGIVRTVGFELPDSSPEAVPDLNPDVSRFSNEDLQFTETGCQTESLETESSQQKVDSDVMAGKDHQIQELTREVENLTRIIDDNLQVVGETETKLNHEIYETKEKLHEVEELNGALKERLAAAEEKSTLIEQQLQEVKADKTKPSVRTSSFGGLELVQQQLEKLRTQLDEKDAVLQEKNKEVTLLKSQHNDAVMLVEEVLDEVRDVKAEKQAMQDDRDGLKIQLEDARIQSEKREQEFKEMEEFLTIERDLQDNSIMYKQYGEDLVTDLQKKVADLEKTSSDSQVMIMDLTKKLSTSNTAMQELQLKLTTAENELKQLTNEKADFEMYQDLEREKHKRRETELTAQLEDAYRENSELRSSTGTSVMGQNTSVMGQSLDMSLQAALACHMGAGGGGNLEASMAAADNLQMEQLNAQIADLQEQVSRLTGEVGEVQAEKESAVAMVKEELAKVSDEQTNLQEEKRKLEEELAKLQEKLALENQHHSDQLNKSVEEQQRLESEKLVLESEKQSLEKEKVAMSEEKSCLEQEKITFNEEKQALQEKLSEVEEGRSALEEQRAVLVEEKTSLEREKVTLEEDRLKIQQERTCIEEVKENLEMEKNTLESDKEQLKNMKSELEEDRLAFEEEKIMDNEMKESNMEEERRQFEVKKEELEEERCLLEKERAEIEMERTKSSETEKHNASDNEALAVERELIAKEKASVEEQQKALEEMLTSLEEERNALDVDREALATEKSKQKNFEEERNVLQLEKGAMEEYVATLEQEVRALKEEREAQEITASSTDDVEGYKEKIAALEKDIEDAKRAFAEEKEDLLKQDSTSEEERKALEKELDDLKKTYEEEKEQIQKEYQLSTEEKESLLKEIEDLKKASQDEKEMLEKENGLSEQEKQLLEEENKSLEEERKSLEVESQKSAEECEMLKGKLNGLEEERKDLLTQLQKAHDEVIQLKEELGQLRSEWDEKKEHIVKEETERRENAISELRSQFEAQRKEDKEQSEKELQEQILAIRTEAMAKLEEAKTMIPIEENLDETAMMCNEVQLEMARTELTHVTSRLKQRELDFHEKVAHITKLGHTIKSLEEKREEDQETIQTLHEEIENLKNGTEAIVIEVKEERDAAWNTIKDMQEEVDRLVKREEELEHQAELHTEEVEQLNECVNEQHAELTKEHEHVVSLEDQLNDLKTSLATLSQEREEDVERINAELELKQSTITKLEDQLTTLSSSPTEVVTSGTASAEEVAHLKAELEKYKECLAATTEERDSERKLMDEADEELEQMKKEKKELESRLTKQISELQAQLETSLHQQAASGTISAPELAKLQKQVQEYKECAAYANEERERCCKLMDEADDELEQLKVEKQKNDSELKSRISQLEDQLSKASSGAISNQEVEDLKKELVSYKQYAAAVVEERDSERKLIDEADEELEELRKEKEANEAQMKKKIAQLEDMLSKASSGTRSRQEVAASGAMNTQEMAQLKKELAEYKERLAAVTEERDSERHLMDEADEELEQMRKEKEANEAELKQKIAELQAGADIEQTNTLKAKLARTEIQERRLRENTTLLEQEVRSYKERVASMRSEIRRLQNQNNETSCEQDKFVQTQRSGRSLPTAQAPAPAAQEPVGIIGSVKVLALESDNAHLKRELSKVTRQNETLKKQLEKFQKKGQDSADERTLKSLPNGTNPAMPTTDSKTKTTHMTTGTAGAIGTTSGTTKGVTGATAVTSGATGATDSYAALLGPTTSGVSLEDDPYVALLGGGSSVIRDLYEPLFRDETKKPAPKEEIEPCIQQ